MIYLHDLQSFTSKEAQWLGIRLCETHCALDTCYLAVYPKPPEDFTRIGCSVICRKSWVVGTGAKTDIAKISCFPVHVPLGSP